MTDITDNTKLLINFDNGDYDLSYYAATTTTGGNFARTTSVKKFGTTAADFADATSTLTITDHAGLVWGDADFTIEFWIYYDGAGPGPCNVIGQESNSSHKWELLQTGSSGEVTLNWRITDTATAEINITANSVSVADATWHHIALERSGDDWSIYINGTAEATVNKDYDAPNYAADLVLTGSSQGHIIDDLRIVAGTAVYDGAFTVPAAGHHLNSDWEALAVTHTPEFFDHFSEKILYTPNGGTARLIDAVIERQPPGSLGTNSQSIRAIVTVKNDPTAGVDPGADSPLQDTITLEPEMGHKRVTWPISFKRYQDRALITYEV
tara:strand:+ start:4609 stop:5580 length:972 start_codon:yes stop_codon:yes gene_type:complete